MKSATESSLLILWLSPCDKIAQNWVLWLVPNVLLVVENYLPVTLFWSCSEVVIISDKHCTPGRVRIRKRDNLLKTFSAVATYVTLLPLRFPHLGICDAKKQFLSQTQRERHRLSLRCGDWRELTHLERWQTEEKRSLASSRSGLHSTCNGYEKGFTVFTSKLQSTLPAFLRSTALTTLFCLTNRYQVQADGEAA